jgi:membrane protease YdiL (CAAX protease family)
MISRNTITQISLNNTTYLSLLLVCGFSAALLLRITIGGVNVAQSQTAALVFATSLFILSAAVGIKSKINTNIVIFGIAGGVFLIIPALLFYHSNYRPYGSYLSWAIVASFVALAEEAFLRGALYKVIQVNLGTSIAIIIPAILFALLHIPLYGWHVLPLDFTVGIFLGGLRTASGSWLAPGISHVLADLAGWWLS